MYGVEDADLLGRAADLNEIVQEIVTRAPKVAPKSMKAIMQPQVSARTQSGDIFEEMKQKNAEREKRIQENQKILRGSDTQRKAKLLQETFDCDFEEDTVDDFIEVFKRYKEEIGIEQPGDRSSRQKTAKEVLAKTFMARRTSDQHQLEFSSEEDGFGDIARFIDEEELDEMDVLRHTSSHAQNSDEEQGEYDGNESASSEEKQADMLKNAVQVLLRGVKQTGRTGRFRADDFLAKSTENAIDDSDILSQFSQITEALQALVVESKDAGTNGTGRKFFSTQEVVDKVKVMRHEADPSASQKPPPPPGIAALKKPSGALGAAPPPPPPASGLPGLKPAGGQGSVGPPPPPPPPPPRPPSGAGSTGTGKGPPPPPPPPPSFGGAKSALPVAPPPPPSMKPGGAPPPPPPPMGGLRKPAPAPPPMGKLRPPSKAPGLLPPKGPLGPPGAPGAPSTGPPSVITPKRNDTKRLNWNTISNMKVNKTLYAKKEFLDAVSLDDETQKELLEKFSSRPPPKVFTDSDGDKSKDDTKGPVTAGILDQKRMTNTLIMLRKFKCAPKAITLAVGKLDPLGEQLSFENVNALCANEFKSEELEMAKNFAAPEEEVEKLNPAENFAYHVARVPRWTMKVRTMLTMRTATEVEGEIKTSLETVITASKEVLQSKRFEKVLAAILAIGNFLNAGTAKGSARGFRLEILPKLSETKGRDRGFNLLHYITDLLEKKDPDALLFPEDMKTVAKAKRISKEDVGRELSAFQRAVAVMGREITAMVKEQEMDGGDPNVSLPSTPPPPKTSRRSSNLSESMLSAPALSPNSQREKDPETVANEEDAVDSTPKKGTSQRTENNALAVAKGMYTKAETAVAELQTLQEEMLRKFSNLAVHLGDEPKSAKTEDFFGTLFNFINSFEQSVKDNRERIEETARKERIATRHAEDSERRRLRSAEKAKQAHTESPDLSPVAVSLENKGGMEMALSRNSSSPTANSSEPNQAITPPQ
ncbi:Formin-like Protein [Chondrus crispus]|uniref:Formin-like Protein n=1 Tax=Chondrus crispus TaxID=2769 RepID=R7QS05_CHOCR|nr:Formin-like Protein [Chondrus crispus]CDF40165.1 Formin-like Protein [Chondrus crispus]|eukprot:XP_005710459.1 Formin-like Protein [Chondrus crispus]